MAFVLEVYGGHCFYQKEVFTFLYRKFTNCPLPVSDIVGIVLMSSQGY